MRLGGPVFDKCEDPQAWVASLVKLGYRAAYCPVGPDADDATVEAYKSAALRAEIVIAEVGVWCSPLSPNEQERARALERCKRSLALADRIGAQCCVNVAGSRGPKWDGPSPLDLTKQTFDMIVRMVRDVIDSVKPTRTFYTLEPMPWMYPDSPDSYLELIAAVDRKAFGVHLDVVNMISSPQRYFTNGQFAQECVAKLGGYIKSVHFKDIILREDLTVHLDEARPGAGKLDYRSMLRSLDELDPALPVMLEHLSGAEEYQLAADYVRSVAKEVNVKL